MVCDLREREREGGQLRQEFGKRKSGSQHEPSLQEKTEMKSLSSSCNGMATLQFAEVQQILSQTTCLKIFKERKMQLANARLLNVFKISSED